MAKEPRIQHCPEASAIGARLIEQHHQHLSGARIAYLTTDKERKRKGHVVLGTIEIPNPLTRFFSSGDHESVLGGYDFVMLLSEQAWQAMKQPQRRALVDHELCHAKTDGEGNWGLIGHDVEEFTEIIDRHGLWKRDLQDFGKAIRQLPLEFPVGERAPAAAAAI